MNKTLILIHGRSWKPPEDSLRPLWIDTIKWGLSKDSPEANTRFQDLSVEFVYFGDISNDFLEEASGEQRPDDTASRQGTLKQLQAWNRDAFTKETYKRLPGQSSWKETLAGALGPAFSFLNIGDEVIEKVAPDMGHYWDDESTFAMELMQPMVETLTAALDRNDQVAIVAHSLGSMITYDTLWNLSWESQFVNYWDKKVDLFLTLGSPLADGTVRGHLRGQQASEERRYPKNIKRWVNIAAEDDYISHDRTMANDFRKMERLNLIESIEDRAIYNLAVRDGESNPHHSGGYLIHPTTTQILADWILS